MEFVTWGGELLGSSLGATLIVLPISMVVAFILRKFSRLDNNETVLIGVIVGGLVATPAIIRGGGTDVGPHPSVSSAFAGLIILGFYRIYANRKARRSHAAKAEK